MPKTAAYVLGQRFMDYNGSRCVKPKTGRKRLEKEEWPVSIIMMAFEYGKNVRLVCHNHDKYVKINAFCIPMCAKINQVFIRPGA